MGKRSKIILWVIIILAVAAVIAALANKHKGPQQTSQTQQQATGIKVVNAPKNQLISGFPSGLILGSATKTISSYSIPSTRPGGATQYTADFHTQTSIKDEYSAYLKYLGDNQYNIIQQQYNKSEANAMLYAKVGNKTINALITKATDGSTNVLITYLVQ